MARPKMQQALREHGYSYHAFAKTLDVSNRTVCDWITGKTKCIRSFYVPIICGKLGLDPIDLEDEPLALIPYIDEHESSEKHEVLDTDLEIEARMEISRREASYAFLQAAGITFLPGTTTLSVPAITTPEQSLPQHAAVINAAWKFLKQADYNSIEELLSPHESTLMQLANIGSAYQKLAAKLAVQVRLMQMQLATGKLDYLGREALGLDAVRLARIAGDKSSLAVARYWYGDTYVYCDRLPETAIPILKKALSGLPSGAPLSSTIFIDLAIAHAQYEDKTKAQVNEGIALEYINMAWETLPKHPETDPLYPWLTLIGSGDLDQLEGKVYLYLAELSPKSDYAQQAYDKFHLSTNKQAISVGMQVQSLIRKSDAARALGDMNHFVDCLTDGLVIAIKFGSPKRISDAHDVMNRIPPNWQKETQVVDLQKEISERLPKDRSRAMVLAR